MKMPSIDDVAQRLFNIKQMYTSDDEIDVRLQVYKNDKWMIHTGDACYDTDHTGHWGAGEVDRHTNCRELAKDLISQCAESAVEAAQAWIALATLRRVGNTRQGNDQCRRLTMASISKVTEVIITTTPAELRELADELQAHFDSAKLGESLTVSAFEDKDIVIKFCCDQTEMQ